MTAGPAVRLGLLGGGRWGRNLMRNMDALGALAAFASTRPESRAQAAEAYPGIRLHETPEALFAAGDLDGVVIATPAVTHGPLAAKALAAGKHVFVEKPLCLDAAEGERLRAIAAARGLTLMVGHQLLYHPAFRALLSLVEAGEIGPLRNAYSHRLMPPRPAMPEGAHEDAQEDAQEDAREDVLWGLAPHDVSMLLALAGGTPAQASATGEAGPAPRAGHVVAGLTFPGGLRAHLFVSFRHPFREQRFVATGERGAIVFEDTAAGEAKLRLYRPRSGAPAEMRAIPYAPDEPLRLECEAFLAALRGDGPPLSNADEGVRVLRVLEACERSLASGGPVAVKSGVDDH